MTIDDKIRNEKLQYAVNREEVKTSASLGKTDTYEYLTGKQVLSFDQSKVIEQPNLLFLLQEKVQKNKEKQLKFKEENNLELQKFKNLMFNN